MYGFMPRPRSVETVMVVLVPIVQRLSGEKLAEWYSQDRGQPVSEYRRWHDNPARGCVELPLRDIDLSR
jgi:hypothetical protein